jgi:hypothetical protein
MAKPRRPTQVPQHTRRLTREEAARRGVSFSAKRQVRAEIKRVTQRTKLYTDREVATAKIRRITGNRQATRETYARERKARAHTEKLIVIQPGGTFVDVTVQGPTSEKFEPAISRWLRLGRETASRVIAHLLSGS